MDSAFTKFIYSQTELTYLKDTDSLEIQRKNVEELILRAHLNSCFGVCVREAWVSFAAELIKERQSALKVVSVAGFPNGFAFTTLEKMKLVEVAFMHGAFDVDIVINMHWLKEKRYSLIKEEWKQIHQLVGEKTLKIIFENSLLTLDEKKYLYPLAAEVFLDNPRGYRFFKTNTGYNGVAQTQDVELMSQFTQKIIGIKPAGGIKNIEMAKSFYDIIQKNDVPLFRIGSSSIV